MILCALQLLAAYLMAASQSFTAADSSGEPQQVATFESLHRLPSTLQNDPLRSSQLHDILLEAERIRNLPLVQRATTLQELENPGSRRLGGIDKRTYTVKKTDAKKAEIFAIASSDLENTAMIGRDLPLLAAAYAITRENTYLSRILDQLAETVQWEPLQRPGWELYTATHSLPPDGNDGVWLATGQGLAAICQTLAILPESSIPEDLKSKVREQLKREVARITRDWKARRMWFVKNDVPTTNQWIVPAAGQAMACAFLGKQADPESYEMAVSNLLKSVEALGDDGSTSEGTEYSQHWTAPFLFMAARALKEAGDDRLASKEFFKNYPGWLALRYQPGGWMVNASDNWGGATGLYYRNASDFARLAYLTHSGSLVWTLRNVIRITPYDFYGLMSLTIPEAEQKEPGLSALYERGRCFIWRNNWEESGSGVWVRGGDSRDGHDHYDRGHVNFIAGGKAVLIEAGTPGYDDARKRDKFDSVIGHNVLQVGEDMFPAKVPAPISVLSAGSGGGEISVSAGDGYPQITRWDRHVKWTASKMEITDEVVLKEPNTVKFRWHFASEEPFAITREGDKCQIARLSSGKISFVPKPDPIEQASDWIPPGKIELSTPGVTVRIEADQGIECMQEKNLDHVIAFRNPNHLHTTLVIRSKEPVTSIRVKTTIDVGENTPGDSTEKNL